MEHVVKENKMNFVFKPSLQHMAMAKIVIEMWKRDDVWALKSKIWDNLLGNANNAKYKVKLNVQELPLPDLLKRQLSALISPISIQMLQWYQYLRQEFSLERINPNELCWTSYGTIDRKKSVLVLVNDQRLDVVQRYNLACTYCLTDEIKELLKELRNGQPDNWINNLRGHVAIFWTWYLTGDAAKLNAIMAMQGGSNLSPGVFAFQSAVFTFNSVGAKYLFENVLNPAEKEAVDSYEQQLFHRFAYFWWNSYDAITSREFNSNLVCFLHSLMDRDQQIEIFKKHPAEMLKCVLVWPYQCFFVETAKRMWRFLSKDRFTSLVFEIFGRIDYGCKVCVYRDIFCQFWQLSSIEYRKYVVDSIAFKSELFSMLEKGEEDICKLILAETSAAEKQQLVGDGYLAALFFAKIIANGKWNMLKFFLTECAPSQETIVRVKIGMMKICKPLKAFENHKREFFQILESFILDKQIKKDNNL